MRLSFFDENFQSTGLLDQNAVNAEPIQRFEAFLSRLSKVDVQSIFDNGLHEFLDASQVEIASIGAHLYTNYMYHPPVDLQAEIRFQQQQEQQQQ